MSLRKVAACILVLAAMAHAEIPSGVVVEEIISKDGHAATAPPSNRFTVNVQSERRSDAFLVTTEVTDTKGGDSAADIYYQIPVNPDGATWHGDPLKPTPIRNSDLSQSFYPISVITNEANFGQAIAITPETPCLFTAGYSAEHSLYVVARVGFSDLTKPASHARICFAVYPVDPQWGMRSAFEKYYKLFPQSYARADNTKDGLWIFHGKSTVCPNPDQFAFHCLGELGECQLAGKTVPQLLTPDEIRREHESGTVIHPYVIPGQREVGFLDHLKNEKKLATPAEEQDEVRDVKSHYSNAEALALLDSMTEKNYTLSQNIQPLDVYKQAVKNSCLYDADGSIQTRPRSTQWSNMSLTFPTNPNPFIPGHDDSTNVGTLTLTQCKKWLDTGNYDGIYTDSLYRWGIYLNYRHDQFPAARYGLTYGPDGRPCLSNSLEHLVWLDEVGKLCRSMGKAVSANGVRSICFFHAHRLDYAGSEFGFPITLPALAYRRFIMYHKPYMGMNHKMGGPKDPDYLARSFLFACFAGGETDYYTSDAFKKDSATYYAILPIQREMAKLGWEPVTYARSSDPKLHIERFGQKDTFIFSLYAGPGAKETSVQLDINHLGLTPDHFTVSDAFMGKQLPVDADKTGLINVDSIPLQYSGVGAIKIEKH